MNTQAKSISKDYRQKIERIVYWLQEKQAQNIVALDVHQINAITEGLVIASGQSYRHTQALAEWLLEKLGQNNLEYLGMEGFNNGFWILIDCNDVVVHIFQQDYREFYNLEGLWPEAPRIISNSGTE